ncbi:replication factor A protein 3-domain-containing protein [Daldinia bambusicola]|nr:replication factor A protein 3-domain-containing protein [Daldinia bambusicola]
MERTSTPRISAALLESYIGQNVIIVGKVVQLRGDTASIEADGHIQASLTRDCHLMVGNGAQIIGKVNPDHTVKVLNAVDLGPNVDYQICQNVVDVTHHFKEIFQQSFSQQSQPKPQFLSQPQPQKKHETRKFADLTDSTASSVATTVSASSSSSEPSQAIIPPTNQFSQLSIQETPQSSHTITQSSALHDTQFSQQPPLVTQDTQYTHYTYEEASSSLRQHKRSQPSQSSRRRRKTPTSFSLDKNGAEISALNPISLPISTQVSIPAATTPVSAESQHYMTSPFPVPPPVPPPVQRRGRLFRTRSGNLATAAEIRRRRELEQHAEELLDMILEGFGNVHSHTITFDMNDSGRWRIVRQDRPEVEVYENA